MRLLPPLLLLLALGCAGAGAGAGGSAEGAPQGRIYRWVDANGVAHYTTDEDRIPASLRRRFGLPTQPLERRPVDSRAPEAAGTEPPAEPPAGVDAWVSEERGAAPVPEEAASSADDDAARAEETLPPVAANASGGADRLSRIELRIAELSAAIAADEDALSAWIGDPAGSDPIEVGAKPEFREIAERLPKRIQELEALLRERDALQSATP